MSHCEDQLLPTDFKWDSFDQTPIKETKRALRNRERERETPIVSAPSFPVDLHKLGLDVGTVVGHVTG